jgi:hypothetical protein
MADEGATYVLIAEVPASGVESFGRYEDAVLPLLADHGGRLERRLRSPDGRREIHVLWFPHPQALDAFRGDPRRLRLARLLDASGAQAELLAVEDVTER